MKASRDSRRAQLVQAALEDEHLLSRKIVNRIWRHFFGRGSLSRSISSTPAIRLRFLVCWNGWRMILLRRVYDLRRLARGIVKTHTYRLDSRGPAESPAVAAGDFAVAQVRLLLLRQYAMSLLTASAGSSLVARSGADPRGSAGRRAGAVRGADTASGAAGSPDDPQLDPAFDHQSSATEALFLSNAPAIQRLVAAGHGTLAHRLAEKTTERSLPRP